MEETPCRCCLREGVLTDVFVGNYGKKTFSDLLIEHLNVNLIRTEEPADRGICVNCIKTLEAAVRFRETVLWNEKKFMAKLAGLSKECYVKVEDIPSMEDEVESEIPSEPPHTLVQHRRPLMTTSSNRVKELIVKLYHSINSYPKPEMTVYKKPAEPEMRPLIDYKKLTQNFKNNKPLPKLKLPTERHKHLHNLKVILQHSNAIPFKSKTVRGYGCRFCFKSFEDPIQLRRHFDSEHLEDKVKYKLKGDIVDFVVRFDITDLKCLLCDENIDNITKLRSHLSEDHGLKFYNTKKDYFLPFKLKKEGSLECVLCLNTYETYKSLYQHMNIHYPNHICDKCKVGFCHKKSLGIHKKIHMKGQFNCEYCGKIFNTKTKKKSHEKVTHLKKRNIADCVHCGQKFTSYYQRNGHMISVHNLNPTYKCKACNRYFLMNALLVKHVKQVHLMEKNYACKLCDYKFYNKNELVNHMVKHTGEKNFKCEFCGKTYGRRKTLIEHLRIHTNDRRFKCYICDMTFVQKTSLKSHLWTNHATKFDSNTLYENK